MSEVTYYFDAYDSGGEEWTSFPDDMVDGIIGVGHEAVTSDDGDIEKCTDNSCPGTDLGMIAKVELRAHGAGDGDDKVYLRPIFSGTDGANYTIVLGTTRSWSSYQDITNDGNAPDWSSWTQVSGLECDVEYDKVGKGNNMYIGKVEIRVTYDPGGPPPSVKRFGIVI